MTDTDAKGSDQYQYHTGIGNETFDTRHAAVGQVAKYLRTDPLYNPGFAGTYVEAVTPDDPCHDHYNRGGDS